MSVNPRRKSTLSKVMKPLRTTHERREDDIYDYEYRLKSGLDLLERTATIASEERALIKDFLTHLKANGLYQCGFRSVYRTAETTIKDRILEEHAPNVAIDMKSNSFYQIDLLAEADQLSPNL